MRRALIRSVLVLVFGIAIAAQSACTQQSSQGRGDWGGMGSGHMRQGQMRGGDWGSNSMGPGQRNWTNMNEGVPEAYRGAVSPRATREMVGSGGRLYAVNCAGCHGARGFGDGEDGRNLVPPPARLSELLRIPMATDEYLLWAVSEGGDRLRTDMPGFGGALERNDIWAIIAYMRSGFPSVGSSQ
jgi:mono/diheme cytochrome c family protein